METGVGLLRGGWPHAQRGRGGVGRGRGLDTGRRVEDGRAAPRWAGTFERGRTVAGPLAQILGGCRRGHDGHVARCVHGNPVVAPSPPSPPPPFLRSALPLWWLAGGPAGSAARLTCSQPHSVSLMGLGVG